MLTEEDRRRGHRLAGPWLERAGESDSLVLAEHFERGGQPERAIAWYERAAEQALGGNDFAATLARAARGSAAAPRARSWGACGLLEAEATTGWPPTTRRGRAATPRSPRCPAGR